VGDLLVMKILDNVVSHFHIYFSGKNNTISIGLPSISTPYSFISLVINLNERTDSDGVDTIQSKYLTEIDSLVNQFSTFHVSCLPAPLRQYSRP
jgi:hypothetical protein